MSDDEIQPVGSDIKIPWPRKGDRLFTSAPDWLNACLNFMPTSSQWYGYARGYKLAADLAVDYIGENKRDQDVLVYPVVFLYRHCIEVMLKSLMYDLRILLHRPAKLPQHHDLQKLWQHCVLLLLEAVPSEEKDDMEAVAEYIAQFARVDRASTAFRYPQDTSADPSLPGLTHINLANLREAVDRLYTFLDAASCAIGAELHAIAEAEEYLRADSFGGP